MEQHIPISTLISQLLVAFTIEFDNEFERQMPHRTAIDKRAAEPGAPWLVSLTCWSNYLQFVPFDGVDAREFARAARLDRTETRQWLKRMRHWGYVTVTPLAESTPDEPRSRWLVRPTAAGSQAQTIWRPLSGTIERRWENRFGSGRIDELRTALHALERQFSTDLPAALPIVGYGWFTDPRVARPRRPTTLAGHEPSLALGALLAKTHLSFTLDFERESPLSLPVCANVVRILSRQSVALRELPGLSGLSKEAVAMAAGYLERHGYIACAPVAARRPKAASLTAKGAAAADAYRARGAELERLWEQRYGRETFRRVRAALLAVRDAHGGGEPCLGAGLRPPPGCWRAHKRYAAQTAALVRDPAAALPHCPAVLHRGGYPDGS